MGLHRAEALEAGHVRGDDAVKLRAGPGLLHELLQVEKGKFLRDRVLVPTSDRFALVLEGMGQGELGSDAIPIRPDMSDHANRLAGLDPIKNAVDDFRSRLHEEIEGSSSSWMIWSTRLPRSTESSMTNRK